MSDHSRKISTVLAAVSSFISYHDKEDYEGVIIVVRQRNGLYEAFTGGSADDPDYADDWGAAQFIVESTFEDMAAMAKDNTPQLQVIAGESTPMSAVPVIPQLSDYPEIMQEIYHKSLHPGTRLNDKGELIDDPGVCHPRLNDQGEWVSIFHPTTPKPMSAFADPCSAAVMLPNGQAPASLNGIGFQAWQSAPRTLAGWVHVEGQLAMDEPALVPKQGKKLAAGVVVMESDGRFWLVAPTNAFGGYKTTFPKGRVESGMSPQATAIKEAFEEAGLQVEITGLIGDFERSTTITRYYTARRLGGLPTQMDWESQAVMLVPKSQLLKILNHANDHAVIQALNKLNLGVNENNDKILIADIGGEGGGATIYGRQTDNAWVFWQEGSSLDADDDIWIPYRSEPVPELDEALPHWWMNAYPMEINPSFIPWFRERYEQHYKNASAFPKDFYCGDEEKEWKDSYCGDRDRWLEILYKIQLPASWATAFGEDEFGLWMELTVQEVKQNFRWIEAGCFLMGSPSDEPERSDNEQQHLVTLTQGYWLAESACTQALWMAVMGGENSARFKEDLNNPVEQVSWDDIQKFLIELNKLPDLNAYLPSEAQWEYACRAGTTTPFSFGDNITPEQVNYEGNSPYNNAEKGLYREKTVSVKSLPPNDWGLYEMHGNVWEWCDDRYGDYSSEPVINPTGATDGTSRVLRGGSWYDDAWFTRSASRDNCSPDFRNLDLGFRFALGQTEAVKQAHTVTTDRQAVAQTVSGGQDDYQ